MARNDLRPEDCIVVEDSERGLAAATAAGLPCLIVLSDWSRGWRFQWSRTGAGKHPGRAGRGAEENEVIDHN